MLKIQLCPEVELENRYWWAPDAATCAGILLVAWFGAGFALDSISSDIARFQETSANWVVQTKKVQPAVEKFKNLDLEVALLNRKIDALKHITVSRVDKILPIVVAEQLQTLRPEGVWFHSAEYTEDRKIKVKGGTSDSLLISEFLLGLRETMNPETITSDVRTQLGFVDTTVKEVKGQDIDQEYSDLKNVLMFEASASVQEKTRQAATGPSMASPSHSTIEKTLF